MDRRNWKQYHSISESFFVRIQAVLLHCGTNECNYNIFNSVRLHFQRPSRARNDELSYAQNFNRYVEHNILYGIATRNEKINIRIKEYFIFLNFVENQLAKLLEFSIPLRVTLLRDLQ